MALLAAPGACTTTTEPVNVCGLRPDLATARLACRDDLPPGALAGPTDYLLATPDLRLTVGRGGGSVNFAGVEGATGLDLARWDGPDRIDEIIPLIDGGWLDVATIALSAEHVEVRGVILSLPGLPPSAREGQDATIVWRADGRAIQATGATRLWVHPNPGSRWDGERLLVGTDAIFGPAGGEDLGGAVVFEGDTIYLASAADAWTWAHPGGTRIRGEAPGASSLWLYADDQQVGEVPIAESFDLRVPSQINGVRAAAEGRAPSDRARPGPALSLRLGPAGRIAVQIDHEGRARSVEARWSGPSGSGKTWMDGDGGTLPTGPGSVDLFLDEVPFRIDVPLDGSADVFFETEDDPEAPWVRVGTSSSGPRWRSRETEAEIQGAASREGQGLTVILGQGRVPTVSHPRSRAGVVVTTADGYALSAWPLPVLPRRSGQGAPDVRRLPLAAALAQIGAERRAVAVELSALEALGAPWLVDPAPTLVTLDAPTDPRTSWASLGAWWTAGRPLVPAGPVTWTQVPGIEPSDLGIEASWLRGAVATGTGPRLWIRVAGAGPGEVARLDDGEEPIASIELLDPGPSQLAVWTDVSWEVGSAAVGAREVALPAHARWAAAAAWSPEGGDWALTGPVWLKIP